MSVLIKGIEIPKEGQVIVIDSTGQVWSNEWPTRGYTRINNAKAEPVKTGIAVGKWLERKVDHTPHLPDGVQSAKCSVCGKYHTTPYMYYFEDYAYCPNCGARMENEE